jgi:hypothetical protein
MSYARICLNVEFHVKKINVDNKVRFHYQVGYWFRLIDASICWARDEADTQFAIFAWLALKKQCLIFKPPFLVSKTSL